MMDITISYYNDMSRISNSNIGWLLKKGPRYLKDMLDGKEEGIKGPALERGTMVHEYILQIEEFWKHYKIFDFESPKSTQQKLFCEEYNKKDILDDLDQAKINAYKKAYKSDKLTNEQILVKAEEIISTYKDYIEGLEESLKYKQISFADLAMLKRIQENIKNHKKANELLYDFGDTFKEYNEFHINWEFPIDGTNVKCKSLLDRFMIDPVNKKVILVDLKTTADVYNFEHSIKEYDYCRQLAYYWMAIHWYFKYELKIDIEEYTYETYIIAIQSNGNNEVKVFNFTPESIESRIPTINKAIDDINWHQQNDKWDHSRIYYEGDGTEEYDYR